LDEVHKRAPQLRYVSGQSPVDRLTHDKAANFNLEFQKKDMKLAQQQISERYEIFRRIVVQPLHRHPFLIPVITFLVLFFLMSAAYVNANARTVGARDSRVVHVHDEGQERTVPTRAKTVGELLERLNIEVSEHDVVEPAVTTEILEDNFQVNVYRAHPVTIIDGDKKVTTMSAHDEPAKAAKAAGVKVYPEDKVNLKEADDFLRDGIIGKKIVINRATPAHINLYGAAIPVRTHAKTVGDLLKEMEIKTVEGDTVQPAPDTPIGPNTQVFVVRPGKQVATHEEEIPMPVETTLDPLSPEGTLVVHEEGQPGRKLVTYEIQLENNQEVGRRVLQEIIAAHPQKRVVVRGTKVIYSNPSANVELGRQIATSMGYAGQFDCIYSVFNRESGWNHLARNPSGAYGIPQALPGSKMGPGWESDPAVQIRWGIGYMVNRYGSPCGAYQFWLVNHWY
jgi:uncharacterized protein YabE (DUF348 family)